MSASAQPFALRRTPRASLSKVVAEQIMDAIQDLEPGTRVPSERELTRMLGVSRATLREALHGLVALGLIEIRHGQGAFVTAGGPDLAEVDELGAVLAKGITTDLIEAGRVIVIELARLAAERRTDEDLENMRAAIEAHRRAIDERRNSAIEGQRFDLALAGAAHNEVLAGVLRSFSRLIFARARRSLDSSPDFWEPDIEDHQAILAAIAARDAEAAVARMTSHIDAVERAYRLSGQA